MNDEVLAPFFESENDVERERIMGELIVRRADPVARRVVGRYRFSSSALAQEDVDDILATVRLRLLQKLRALANADGDVVERFDDYVATLTYHTIYDFLRRRFPQRARLKNQMRYLLLNDPRFDLWNTGEGTVCGPREWRHSRAVSPSNITDLPGRHEAPAAIHAVLRQAGGPVLLDDLVRVLADAWSVTDAVSSRADLLADLQPLPGSQLESRQYLDALWREILALRPLQRAALLLNMRDDDGTNAIAHLVLIGAATMEEIAGAVEMSIEELSTLWNDLPLDDLRLASRFGVTRQQVINLRRAARERLARRLSAYRNERPS